MEITVDKILLLFKKMFCDELKNMIPDQKLAIDILVRDTYNFAVIFERMKTKSICMCELLVDPDNRLMHIELTPIVPNKLEDLLLPGKQCPDELLILYEQLKLLLSHPELTQNYKITYDELELLYKLFIKG